jgi:hypothetical protein
MPPAGSYGLAGKGPTSIGVLRPGVARSVVPLPPVPTAAVPAVGTHDVDWTGTDPPPELMIDGPSPGDPAPVDAWGPWAPPDVAETLPVVVVVTEPVGELAPLAAEDDTPEVETVTELVEELEPNDDVPAPLTTKESGPVPVAI